MERAIDAGYGWTKFSTGNFYFSNGKIGVDVKEFQSLPRLVPRETFARLVGVETQGTTVGVKVKNQSYLVSEDFCYSTDTLRPRNHNYCSTHQYEVCMGAALKAMNVDFLDHLVVGAPCGNYEATVALLKEKFGRGIIIDDKAVEIRNLHVVARPVGGLIWHYFAKGLHKQLGQQKRVLVDVGHGTLDWVAVQGLQTNFERSGSVQLGVGHFVDRIVEEMKGVKAPEDVWFSNQVERMLLRDQPVIFGNHAHRLEDYQALIQQVATEGVQHIESSIGDERMYQSVVLMGGGAPLYKDALNKAFNSTTVEVVDAARFANVRGFQLLAQNMAHRGTRASPEKGAAVNLGQESVR